MSIKSQSGKTFVTLTVEVDYPLPQVVPHQPHDGGPARVRRRARRAAFRAAAENSNEVPEAEKVKGDQQDVESEAAKASNYDTN